MMVCMVVDPADSFYLTDDNSFLTEIITALSRIRWLFVIARNSTFTYKGQAVDVKRVGRELGVRYVLGCSLRWPGHHWRKPGYTERPRETCRSAGAHGERQHG
jgi:TolB-like protein